MSYNHIDRIPRRILEMGYSALAQANTQAVYGGPGTDAGSDALSIVNSAFAGELIIKAIIAKQHPLLIFKNLFELGPADTSPISIDRLLLKGKTYTFGELPNLLWTCTGNQISDLNLFKDIQQARNAIVHFCSPDDPNLKSLSLRFLYQVVDPLLNEHFDECAIEFHNDHSVDYSYIVSCLFSHEILFSVPDGFNTSEIDHVAELETTNKDYQLEMRKRIRLASK